MPKAYIPSPYRGTIAWSSDTYQWVIEVRNPDGSRATSQAILREMFDIPLLWRHLVSAYLTISDVEFYEQVLLVKPEFVSSKGRPVVKLLGVLKKFYPWHKGRPIEWRIA